MTCCPQTSLGIPDLPVRTRYCLCFTRRYCIEQKGVLKKSSSELRVPDDKGQASQHPWGPFGPFLVLFWDVFAKMPRISCRQASIHRFRNDFHSDLMPWGLGVRKSVKIGSQNRQFRDLRPREVPKGSPGGPQGSISRSVLGF